MDRGTSVKEPTYFALFDSRGTWKIAGPAASAKELETRIKLAHTMQYSGGPIYIFQTELHAMKLDKKQ